MDQIGLQTKVIIGYAFPVPGKGKEASDSPLKSLPKTKTLSHLSLTPLSVPDSLAAIR